MTAIMAFEVDGYPCMIGDLMLSSEISPKDPQLPIPVSGIPSGQNKIWWGFRYVAGFRQKLVSISDNLMVGWAGSSQQAHELIATFKEACRHGPAQTLDEYEEIFRSINPTAYNNLQFLATIACDDGWQGKEYLTEKIELPDGTIAAVAGTGTEHLKETFDHSTSYSAPVGFNRALGKALLVAGRMWFWDVVGSATELAFGGGYEVAIRQNNRMTKIGDILYANLVYVPGKGIATLGLFKKIDYVDDALILRVIEIHAENNLDQLTLHRAATYLIPSAGNSPTNSQAEKIFGKVPDLHASHFVTHIRIDSENEGQEPHSACIYFCNIEKTAPQIAFNQTSDGKIASVTFSTEYIEQIIRETRSVVEQAGETFNLG